MTGAGSVGAAAVAAGLATLVAIPSRRWPSRLGPLRAAPMPTTVDRAPVLAVAGAVAVAIAVGLALACAGLGAALLGWRRRARAARARETQQRRDVVVDLCDALATELRAGARPATALEAAARQVGRPVVRPGSPADGHVAAPLPLEALAAEVSAGGDASHALRRCALEPGADGLELLASCWAIAAPRGAGLASAVDHVAAALRAEEAAHREVAAQLAAPRSTARVLAGLPLFGLALGTAIGGAPLGVLRHTPIGVACAVAAALLTAAGVAWVDQLAAQAERAQ